ncbi:MAG: hypothetical protein PHI16_01950 [Methanocellales archaeon]|nr:hypothetical protein [Methanocellales archaeon]
MKHNEIVEKVCDWFKYNLHNYEIKKEVQYKINLPKTGLNKQFFRVDIVVTNKNINQKIGVECKTLRDSSSFRKLMAGIGQAYILQRVFGLSYLAIEVEPDMLQNKNPFEFYKRVTLLPNVHQELGIGILLVQNNVILVEEAKFVEPFAKTLFINLKEKRCHEGS